MAKKNIENKTVVSYNVGKTFEGNKFEAVVTAAFMVNMNVDIMFNHGFDVKGDVHILLEKGRRRVNYQILIGSTDLDLMALAGSVKPTTALWLTQKAEKLAESAEDIIFGEE